MRLSSFFDGVVVIHLPERSDRLPDLVEQLARVGERLDGERVRLFHGVRPKDADGFPSRGKRGAFLSHRGVARLARERGWGRTLVLEDDVEFSDDFLESWPVAAAGLEGRTWEVAFLGHLNVPGGTPGRPEWVGYDGRRVGMHCYALNGSVLDRLLDYMNAVEVRPPGHPEGARMGADATFDMFCRGHAPETSLLALPSLAGQAASASSITPGLIDRLLPFASFTRSLRRIRDRILRPGRGGGGIVRAREGAAPTGQSQERS